MKSLSLSAGVAWRSKRARSGHPEIKITSQRPLWNLSHSCHYSYLGCCQSPPNGVTFLIMMRTKTHVHQARFELTEAQRNTSQHRKEKHLCERCREGKKCDALIKLALLENNALARWIDAYEASSKLTPAQFLNSYGQYVSTY